MRRWCVELTLVRDPRRLLKVEIVFSKDRCVNIGMPKHLSQSVLKSHNVYSAP